MNKAIYDGIMVVVNIISLCLGIFLYEYMTDADYLQAWQNSSYAALGCLFGYSNKESDDE